MTKRVLQTFSLTDEILQVLDEICKDTGMKRSVVVQELILKAGKDKKTREIITNENYMRVARKKMGATSHNVQNDNQKKADPEPYQDQQDPGKGPLTLSHDEFGIIKKPTYEEFQEVMKRCKDIWRQ